MTQKSMGNGFKELLGLLAEIVAFFTIVLFAVLIANANWPFIAEGTFLDIMNVCKFYAPLVLVLIVSLEMTSSRPFLIRIVFYAVIAAIIVFQFFPGTWSNFVGI